LEYETAKCHITLSSNVGRDQGGNSDVDWLCLEISATERAQGGSGATSDWRGRSQLGFRDSSSSIIHE